MGKKNIVFNLTIDDLKELGIIKPRRRRRRTNKIMQYLQQQQQPSNIKSTSEQMTGYSNVFNNNNTSNLQTENLRLQNNLLDKYPMLKMESNNNNESRFKTIEDGTKKSNDYITYILQSAYGGEFSYRPMNKYKSLRSQPLIDESPEKDNIDVAATAGSEGFKSLDDKNDDDKTKSSIPTTPQIGIRSPPGVNNNNEDEEENPNDTTFNEVGSVEDDSEEEPEPTAAPAAAAPDEEELEEDSEDDSEEDSEEEEEEPIQKPIAKPTAPQTRARANPQLKPKSQPLPKEETLFELKARYAQLGGDNNDILTSNKVLPVRVAIATLLREAKAEARKNKKKKN
jgi:hypothetical protein